MSPSSDQPGEGWCLPFLCLFPGSCHKAADSSGCHRGHCTHALRIPACPVYDPPSRLARAGLGATPEVVRSTPLSPANTSCWGPRWGGAGGALTSGDVISALGVRGSTLWMRPSLLVGGEGKGGRKGLSPLSPGGGGHLGKNQGRIHQPLMFKATISQGMRKCPLRILMALKTPAVSVLPPAPRSFKDRDETMPPQLRLPLANNWLWFSVCAHARACACVRVQVHAVIWAR